MRSSTMRMSAFREITRSPFMVIAVAPRRTSAPRGVSRGKGNSDVEGRNTRTLTIVKSRRLEHSFGHGFERLPEERGTKCPCDGFTAVSPIEKVCSHRGQARLQWIGLVEFEMSSGLPSCGIWQQVKLLRDLRKRPVSIRADLNGVRGRRAIDEVPGRASYVE